MKLFLEFSGQIACEIGQRQTPFPHSIRLLFFMIKICITLACFRGSRRTLRTLFGAEQILVSSKKAMALGFWSQRQIFIF